MELARVSNSLASHWASVLARDTTVIIAKVIDGVLLSVLLELIEAVFSI